MRGAEFSSNESKSESKMINCNCVCVCCACAMAQSKQAIFIEMDEATWAHNTHTKWYTTHATTFDHTIKRDHRTWDNRSVEFARLRVLVHMKRHGCVRSPHVSNVSWHVDRFCCDTNPCNDLQFHGNAVSRAHKSVNIIVAFDGDALSHCHCN